MVGMIVNMKLCSACLLGINCRYDGIPKVNEKVSALLEREILIPVCPEQLGGQATPRPNSEIFGGDGLAVLCGQAQVIETSGADVTKYFIRGAQETLKLVNLYGVKEVILKARSPSCGSGQIYDGTFSKTLISGDGVTSALLKKYGVSVISEQDL